LRLVPREAGANPLPHSGAYSRVPEYYRSSRLRPCNHHLPFFGPFPGRVSLPDPATGDQAARPVHALTSAGARGDQLAAPLDRRAAIKGASVPGPPYLDRGSLTERGQTVSNRPYLCSFL